MFFSRCKELLFRTTANPKLEIEASANCVNCATVKAKKDLRRKNYFFSVQTVTQNDKTNGRSDIFSLGNLCCELVFIMRLKAKQLFHSNEVRSVKKINKSKLMFDVYWCGFIVKTVIYLRLSLFAATTDHTSASYLWVNTV